MFLLAELGEQYTTYLKHHPLRHSMVLISGGHRVVNHPWPRPANHSAAWLVRPTRRRHGGAPSGWCCLPAWWRPWRTCSQVCLFGTRTCICMHMVPVALARPDWHTPAPVLFPSPELFALPQHVAATVQGTLDASSPLWPCHRATSPHGQPHIN